MLTLWIVVSAIGVLELVEMGVLVGLLRAFGQMKQQGDLTQKQTQASGEWGLAVGEKAPSFVTTDYEDRPVRLDDFHGHRRILAFILPGCSSCADTMKTLNTFARNEDATTVLVIGGSDRDLNHAYAIEHETQLPVLTPTRDFYGELYRIRGVPFVFVIDEAGIIRAKGVVNDVKQLQQLLTAAVALVSASQ